MSHPEALIAVDGAWATLHHASLAHLETCLAILDPKRFFNRAFRERRWDGKVRLFRGRTFPAGLVAHVTDFLIREGIPVRTTALEDATPLDLSRLDGQYLGPIGPTGGDLWPHQLDAIRALLTHTRGIVKIPTGGGKTEIIAAGARYLWEERGWHSLIVVPRRGLCAQTRERLRRYYGDTPTVGQYGDSVKEPGDIVVATAQTLAAFRQRTRRQHRRMLLVPADRTIARLVETAHVLWLDEAHHASSNLWYDLALYSRAVRRYGLSGTPLRGEDLSDLRLIGATGPVLHDVSAPTLIDLGLAAQPKIAVVDAVAASGPALPKVWTQQFSRKTGRVERVAKPLPYKDAYPRAIVHGTAHNRAVLRAVEWLVDHHRPTLVLCRTKAHWGVLRDLLKASGIDFHALWGATEIAVRNEAKRQLRDRQTQCVLATTIWDEGEDVPEIGAIVLAEGVKTPINVLQRIGRGMRVKRDGPNDVWVVDFVPTCHERLRAHGEARVHAYTDEGYEVVRVTRWPLADARETPPDLLPFATWAQARALAPTRPRARVKPQRIAPVKHPKTPARAR